MQAQLGMSATQAGWIGSANFIGYFIGLFFAASFFNRFGSFTIIKRSLITQSFFIILMSFSWEYILASFAFLGAGFFGALANIAVVSYITQIVPKEHKAKAVGSIIIGIGVAIMLSGLIIPVLEEFYALQSWRIAWFSFGVIIFSITFFLKKGLNYTPHAHTQNQKETSLTLLKALTNRSFIHVSFMYFIFGTTYVIYVTFFVLAAQVQWQASTNVSGSFWILLGFASIFAGPLFGTIADRIGNYKALTIIFFIQTIAHSILAFQTPAYMLWFSALLFGISTWGVPTLMAVLSSELFGPKHTAKILSWVTIFFAVGQIVGPIGAGWAIDFFGNFFYVFALCASLTFIALVVSIFAHKHSKKA